MGIVEITCPDCGGQLHRESFVGNQGNGKQPYTNYFCVGQTDYHVGFDAASCRSHGCGFSVRSKGHSGEKRRTVTSDKLDNWEDWEVHKDDFE